MAAADAVTMIMPPLISDSFRRHATDAADAATRADYV
jgi:hypothetical protein